MSRPDFRAVVRSHEYALTLRTGAICTCGYTPPREPGSLRSQQDWHCDHLALVLQDALSDWLAVVIRRLPLLTEGADRAGTETWRENDRNVYSLAIEEAQAALRSLTTP